MEKFNPDIIDDRKLANNEIYDDVELKSENYEKTPNKKTIREKNEYKEELKEFDESKDISKSVKEDEFNIKNIDFKNLKKRLNNVYKDEKLTANAINHIKFTLDSSIEVQWETGTKNRIIEKIIGKENSVKPSDKLLERAKNGEKTLWIGHNHTSGTPLPNPIDLTNMFDYRIVNSGIVGNYGYLNMKNRFKKFNEDDLHDIENKTKKLYDDLKNKAFKYSHYMKYESEKVRNGVIYKYNKGNINNIVKKYNNEFEPYGIEFKYIPYKFKKR